MGPVYGCPNSPGENERVEQKPSDELIIKVNPSFDLPGISMKAKEGRK